jgi:5-methylcytosine-specific restriction endonuclease McrA
MTVQHRYPKVPMRTTLGFSFSMLERALFECLGDRKFGMSEIEQVLAFFKNEPPECVFCGSQEVRRWDHLIPIKKGGETVLGNMVPSCARCDDSKRDLSIEEWMLGNAPNSPKNRGMVDVERRVQRIYEYMTCFGYQPRRLEERLTPEERAQVEQVRDEMQRLQENMQDLIQNYQKRNRIGRL